MTDALRAELYLLRRRSVVHVIALVWTLLVCVFGYVVPFIIGKTLPDPDDRAALLGVLSVPMYPSTSLSSYPLFGGGIMVVLGALLGGSEWGWGTWKVRLTQGPSRWQVVLSKFVAGAVAGAVVALVAQLVSLGLCAVLAATSGLSTSMPRIGPFLGSLGSAVLVSAAFTCLGLGLAVVLRSLSMALIVGLLWVLVFESIVSGLVLLWKPLSFIQKALIGSASGSLPAALGAKPLAKGGTPGVVDALSPGGAVLVLLIYIAVAVISSGVLMNRRDIN